MASDYPGAIDGLAATHADVEDSVLAVQGELGANPSGAAATVVARLAALDTTVAGKADTGAAVTDAQIPATIARDTEVTAAVVAHEAAADPHPGYLTEASATATYATVAGLAEAVQDIVGTSVVAGAGVTVTYDDVAGTITIAGGSGTGLDAEGVRDTIGAALVAGSRITVTVNDAADTITIATTATAVTVDTVAVGTLALSSAAVTATDIAFTPTGTIAATTTQAAVAEVASEAAAALTAHEAAANPHPIYLTQAEADALYSGGGGSALTVQDEGGALTTAASTINFVGAGVTASGTGATKTVTIPGGGGSAVVLRPLSVGRYYDGAENYAAATHSAFITGRLYGAGWEVPEAVTIDTLALRTNVANAGVTVRMMVYATDSNGEPSAKLYDSGDVALDTVNQGVHTMTAPLALTAGFYYLASTFSAGVSGALSRTVLQGRPRGEDSATGTDMSTDQFFGTHTYGVGPATFPTPNGSPLLVPAVRARVASKP